LAAQAFEESPDVRKRSEPTSSERVEYGSQLFTGPAPQEGSPAMSPRVSPTRCNRARFTCVGGPPRGELLIRGSQVRLLPGAPENQGVAEHRRFTVTENGIRLSPKNVRPAVRSHPVSRFAPQFNSESLREHRVGRVMAAHGFELSHVRGNGSTQSEADLTDEELRKNPPTLFPVPWRSAAPLRHKTLGTAETEEL